MKPDLKRIRELFIASVGMGDPQQREVFLENECREDQELLGEVRLRLDAHREAGSFLEGLAVDLAATGDSRTSPAPGDCSLEAAAPDHCGTVIGPYKLLQPIGEGGMGTVYIRPDVEERSRVRSRVAVSPGMNGKDRLTQEAPNTIPSRYTSSRYDRGTQGSLENDSQQSGG